MSRIERIKAALADLEPKVLELADDSADHAGHHAMAGADRSEPTHLRLTIVSDRFAQQNTVARHREIYARLQLELDGGLHALQIRAMTPAEYQS